MVSPPQSPSDKQPHKAASPPNLKSGIESLSGIAMDDVRVHYNSSKPAQLQAHAYAQGTDIHIAPGQERHLPHEAWHVVQQKQGRVKPTLQLKGVAINDDSALEREADVMGGRAMGIPRAENPVQTCSLLPVAQRAVIQCGGMSSKGGSEDAILASEYESHLQKAKTALLGKIGFGASPESKYDAEHWEAVDDPDYLKALKCRTKPSLAMVEMVNSPSKWSFDCAEFVQVCNIYASCMTYGGEQVDKQYPDFRLRQHDSTIFQAGGITFVRNDKDAKFDVLVKKAKNAVVGQGIDEKTLVENLPIGSRVCFKNPKGEGTPFRNENAFVEGKGKFAAHPMGSNLTEQDIVDELVKYNIKTQRNHPTDGREQIFISSAEIYTTMSITNETMAALGLKFDKDTWI
ncbi:MAG: DUF4157 domain-containing protein [Bacteroidia bacterium]